ncbi:MAG: 2-amino-4-hydroxy-6-hydroxymethyldihydropteridine diphosphokinase [Desulfatibacillum sp.]|nr:2-amino-4-hydroxy-6-hydroxymethyldihydropteridine diphosphokinase [Desulfatibacillum sp.]
MQHTAYIGFGSNMGDLKKNCQWAMDRLNQSGLCAVEQISRLYDTEPVDFEAQDRFLNGAARIKTSLEPRDLLALLKSLEKEAGRTNSGPRFGPRVLDMDILFYNELVMEDGDLDIPHPRLHKRRFVLAPLCDIAPELQHPVLKKTVSSLLEKLDDGGKDVTILDQVLEIPAQVLAL